MLAVPVPDHRAPKTSDSAAMAAARRLASLESGLEPSASSDFMYLFNVLVRWNQHRWPFSTSDSEDLASQVLADFLDRVRAGKVDANLNPLSYLFTAARWAALSKLRERTPDRPTILSLQDISVNYAPSMGPSGFGDPSESLDDSADELVARQFETDASVERVNRALATARERGDHTAYRVVTVMLDEIDAFGDPPSLREVARRLNMSHPGVSKALARFKDYLRSADP